MMKDIMVVMLPPGSTSSRTFWLTLISRSRKRCLHCVDVQLVGKQVIACKREKSIMCCVLVVNKITSFYQAAGYGWHNSETAHNHQLMNTMCFCKLLSNDVAKSMSNSWMVVRHSALIIQHYFVCLVRVMLFVACIDFAWFNWAVIVVLSDSSVHCLLMMLLRLVPEAFFLSYGDSLLWIFWGGLEISFVIMLKARRFFVLISKLFLHWWIVDSHQEQLEEESRITWNSFEGGLLLLKLLSTWTILNMWFYGVV